MTRYLIRALGAQWRAGRTLFLLSVAGVALGVGSVLSIQILNESAVGAFDGTVRAVSGEAQLTVVGRTPTIPEAVLPSVLAEPGVRAALPVYRIDVALEGKDGAMLHLVGADLFAPTRLPWSAAARDMAAVLATPGWAAVTPSLAAEMGWRMGDVFAVSSGSRRVKLTVGALVDFRRVAPLASRRLVVMDIAQVQALLGIPGRLHQIDVVAGAGVGVPDLARRLEARLGPAARVVTPEQRVAEAAGLLAAFRLNLTALSLVSLFVGGFLVYATTQAALVRRREEMGVLRCLGATRGQVLGLVLAEASLLGLLGTAAGIPLGWLAARANAGAVSGTLRNLYLLEGIERMALPFGLVVLAAVVGMAGALAGAVLPAIQAARQDPRALLRGRGAANEGGPGAAPLALAGWATCGLVAAAALGPGREWALSGFALALALLVAVPLSTPLLLRGVERLRPPRRLGLAYGARGLAEALGTTAVAVGALAVAMSMLCGITTMVGSFRRTVVDWLETTLRADVYVTTPSWRRARSEATLATTVVERLGAEPGVVAADRLRQFFGEAAGRRVSITGFDARIPQARSRVQLAAGGEDEALRRVRDEGAVLVSEPLARKAGLGVGGALVAQGPAGPIRFAVAGVFRDYGAESGAVLMDLRTMEARFGPGPVSNVALYLAPGIDPEAAVARLKAALGGDPLLIRSNRQLRDDVLAIFEQTFAVTRLLEAMTLVIAVAGITLTLLVLARERAGEVALYRALGATRGQVFLVFVGRGLGIAASGLALGLAGGAGLAAVLVKVVNPAWFGWSLALHWPWTTLGIQACAIFAAAAVASAYPAARATDTPATELSRDAI